MSTQLTQTPTDESPPEGQPRRGRGRLIVGSIGLFVVLGLGWYLVEPALFDDNVDTSFDVSIEQAVAGEVANPGPGDPMDGLPFPDATTTPDVVGSTEPSAAPEPAVDAPVLISSGTFVGLDNHDASGQAAIFTQPDGTRVIRLENLDADNGPELELHLVPGADQTRPGDGTFIAPLQGNQGNQTYVIPEGIDVPDSATILIWCVPFRTAIGGASLTAA